MRYTADQLKNLSYIPGINHISWLYEMISVYNVCTMKGGKLLSFDELYSEVCACIKRSESI